MANLNANDLKIRGVTAIAEALSEQTEALVAVRGRPTYVVMTLDHYQHLRECELDVALAETRADLAAGRVIRESAEAHLERLDAMERS
ncbi:hypothetical protein [Halochromatium roseum]|uniref:hypothetical protein n=1 Tax=Halochromatium roseum TaxID=391920 RepID=UPI0019132BD8|nr:hypothetical protein [Halochromatium roseum]MBK5941836.1 prevent-host-death protein [Halochromatium roseum]